MAAPGQRLMLKWPNDLMLEGRKLAGILLERQGDRVVIGFGVNLAVAPPLPDRLTAHLGSKVPPQAFTPLLAGAMSRMLKLWRSASPAEFARAWQARAHPVGTVLSVHSGAADRVRGIFDGIDSDGSLRLRLDDGSVRVIHAADVSLG